MEIKPFCEESSTDDLNKMWNSSIDQSRSIIARLSNPDIITSITDAIDNDECSNMDDLVIKLSMCFLANQLNIEVIERELFRRKMEDAISD